MAQNDVLKRYIDAGLAFTALTQARAEELVKDLVKVGEVQADQARDAVADLLERSRKNSEKLLETVRTEVRQQITSLGLATPGRPRPHRAADRVGDRHGHRPGQEGEAAAKKAPAKKAPAKKAPAKKAAAKKAPAKKKAAGQEGAGQEVRRRRPDAGAAPPRRRAGAAGPGAQPPAGPGRHRRRARHRRRRARRQGRPGSWRPASRSACSGPARGSSAAAARSSTPRSTRFAVAVEGRRAHDLGASTGGFTDCLLQRGAAAVVAVDVGYGQLHERLRADPRVVVLERTNVRDLRPGDVGQPGRPGGRRPVVHLPPHGAPRGARARRPPAPTWCSSSSRSSRPGARRRLAGEG